MHLVNFLLTLNKGAIFNTYFTKKKKINDKGIFLYHTRNIAIRSYFQSNVPIDQVIR